MALAVALYWTMNIMAWAGLIFFVFSVFNPDYLLKAIVRTVDWKLKLFGLQGRVFPADNARQITRVWAVVLSLVFAGIIYVYTTIDV